jgi:hypothetical protein
MKSDLEFHSCRLVIAALVCSSFAHAALSIHAAEGRSYWQKLSFPEYRKWDFKDDSSLSGHPILAVRVSPGELLFAEEDSSWIARETDQPKQTSLTQ